jgi:hypothetical protein
MAEKLTIPGTQVVVKPRNPVAVGFLSLTIVYLPFYWYAINKELKELGEARGIDLGTSPMTSALAGSLGTFVIVPPYVTSYTTAERIKTAQMATGRKDWLEGWIAIVMLFMLAPLMFGMVQDQLNKVWQNLGMPTPFEKQVLTPGPYYTPQPQPYQPAQPPPPVVGEQPHYAPPPPGHRPPDAPPPV